MRVCKWVFYLVGFGFLFFAVCGPPDLPAGAVVHLVRELGGMERQQDSLEAIGLRGDLPQYALPLPGLLDRTKVKGDVSTMRTSRGFRGYSHFFSGPTKFISSCTFSAGGKDPENSRHQVPPALGLLPVVPHHVAGGVDNDGDVPRPVCLQEAEHAAQLLPHGLGCRWVSFWLPFCESGI